jgi:hypothetical protein
MLSLDSSSMTISFNKSFRTKATACYSLMLLKQYLSNTLLIGLYAYIEYLFSSLYVLIELHEHTVHETLFVSNIE